ncbi:MAG TPA: 4-hydroxythreonine-4-phosphate dehydrogenase PdxA [Polyangiales bacterium]|nr:4-hydroxythreonine-4-phosphate dehydrogenase PdxA [Polyangiales bacterium]
MTQLPLAITTGDPGGVGPEISLRVAVAHSGEDPVVVFGDVSWLRTRAVALGMGADRIRTFRPEEPFELKSGELGLCDVGVPWDDAALAHQPSPQGGRAQLRTLDGAIAAAQRKHVRGLVTAPMSKESVQLGNRGSAFRGHTEHLAQAVGLHDDEVTMLFLGPKLRVGLVTTHISVVHAPAEITLPRVVRTVRHTGEALLRAAPPPAAGRKLRLGVTGLNPHAGESGLFGDEEQQVIAPAIRAALRLSPFSEGRVELVKTPIPAETAFRIALSGELDGVVAMIHDQATIPSKLLDWGSAVNVTWGLPFVRTSVDHGVAYAAAQSGEIDHSGMAAALHLARQLTS